MRGFKLGGKRGGNEAEVGIGLTFFSSFFLESESGEVLGGGFFDFLNDLKKRIVKYT